MLTVRDLEQLARRIERLTSYRGRTQGWDREMEFRNLLPGSRSLQQLPAPDDLRAMAPADAMWHWRNWITWAARAEGIIRDNDRRNPKRIIRDIQRGRVTPQTMPFFTGRRR